MIAQLAAAAASALVLSTILSAFTGVGIGTTFKGLFFGKPGEGGGMGGNFGQFFLSGIDLVTSNNRARQQQGRSVI